jgi:hypothetical protein
MDEDKLTYVWKEVAAGRGNHGDFLQSFARAFGRADDLNRIILEPAAKQLADKYGLWKYLPREGSDVAAL